MKTCRDRLIMLYSLFYRTQLKVSTGSRKQSRVTHNQIRGSEIA